jgi:hypothetical protein
VDLIRIDIRSVLEGTEVLVTRRKGRRVIETGK